MKKCLSLLLVVTLLVTSIVWGSVISAAAADMVPVTMKIDSFTPREVLSFHYAFHRPTDVHGELAGLTKLTSVVIRVKALNDNNTDLFGWILNNQPRTLKLDFVNMPDGKEMKTVTFTGAYCTRYTEYWNIDGTHYEEIEVVAPKVETGGATYETHFN